MRRPAMLAAAFALATFALGGGPARAIHDPDVNDDEFRCQYRTGQIAWRFFYKKGACIRSCQSDVFGGSGDPADCVPPFAGSTQGCVNGAEGKSGGKICKACGDLPECYSGGNCSQAADDKLAIIESDLDALASEIYCDDSGSGDGLTAVEAKCEAVLIKYLGAFAAKKAKCLAKCHAYAHKGAIAASDCTAGAITDPTGKTQYCIQRIEDAVVLKIDKGCSATFGLEAPECHGGKTSQQWVDEVENTVDAEDPGFFCGSPSGAFLEE